MPKTITRRTFGATAAVALATPFIGRAEAAAPIELRCSLDTAPSHPRNVAWRDFLGKIEAASDGQITTRLFESGALFPDLQVVKALVQGQVEMACPGSWTLTGFVPDADFSELPGLHGRPVEVVHKAADGQAGKFVNGEIKDKLHVEVLGGWFDLGFFNWFSTRKPLNSVADLKEMKLRSPGGVLISWRIHYFGAIPNVTAWPDVPLAMSQGTFDGFDQFQRELQQFQVARFWPAPLACRTVRPWGSMCRWSARLSGQSSVPKLQETVLKLWAENLPAWRANTAKSQENARAELAAHNVVFVDVPQAELDAIYAKMVQEQDKAVSDAHISPELVKLVMADVGA